jgi:hypothetical protein
MADDEPAPEFPYHREDPVSGVSALIHAEVPPDAFGPVSGNPTTDDPDEPAWEDPDYPDSDSDAGEFPVGTHRISISLDTGNVHQDQMVISSVKVMCYNTEAEARSIFEQATVHADPFMFGLREIREGVIRMLSSGCEAEDMKVLYLLEVVTVFGWEVCESEIKPVAPFVHSIGLEVDD